MKFGLKSLFYVFAILLFMCFGISFADEANTWYTDFSFDGGLKDKVIIMSGGGTQTVSFYLTNNSDSAISGIFDVVDAIVMTGGLRACKANGQNEIFGQYGVLDKTTFELQGGATFSNFVTLTFPEGYSGEYLGCIVYTPFSKEDVGYLNTQPRKGLFLKAMLNATVSLYKIRVYPGSRSDSNNKKNKGEIRIFSGTTLIYSGADIISDSGGIAEFYALIPDGVYTVIYKGQSHLASYLYDVRIKPGNVPVIFDFTTGFTLSGVQDYTKTKDDGLKYQIAGDLRNTDGIYDFTVNGNDIAIITVSGFVAHVDDLDPRDLNGDNVINVSDLAIVGANFEQEDVFFDGHTYNGLR